MKIDARRSLPGFLLRALCKERTDLLVDVVGREWIIGLEARYVALGLFMAKISQML